VPDFFPPSRELTVDDIASLTRAKPRADTPLDRRIRNVAPLDAAGAGDLTFLDNRKYLRELPTTRAGACLLAPQFEAAEPAALAVLVTEEPYRAFVAVARALFPAALRPSSLFAVSGRAEGAQIHPSARLEAGVTVDPLAVVGPRAEVGAGTLIAAGAVIGPGVCIGRDCAIGAGATILHALIGDRVVIHSGARIGQDGFGFAIMGQAGHAKVPQVGRVIIQDGVEIGANTTIDRGALRDTVIGEGTKIDNLVQIGHNVVIGRHCIIVAQTGISGSAELGDFVALGGQVGVVGHVKIGAGAQIAASSNVRADVPPGVRWGGTPAKPVRLWFRELTLLRKLAESKDLKLDQDDGSSGSGK